MSASGITYCCLDLRASTRITLRFCFIPVFYRILYMQNTSTATTTIFLPHPTCFGAVMFLFFAQPQMQILLYVVL
jgi:hypothetical protein